MAQDDLPWIRFSAMWSDALANAIKARAAGEPYRLSCWQGSEDYEAFAAAISEGIDAHLEAVHFEQSTDYRGAPLFSIDPDTLHTLVRRLMERGDEASDSLAGDICYTLNIELV